MVSGKRGTVAEISNARAKSPSTRELCHIFLDRYYNFTFCDALLDRRFALYEFNSRVTCLLLVRSLLAIGS